MKPFVIFTNFFDANEIVKNKCLTIIPDKEKQAEVEFIWLKNYQINSIAISMPDSSKISVIAPEIKRIDCFCPTYNMLKEYKEKSDWEKYKKDYRQILVKRKDTIDQWLNRMEDDKIYLLCCWENTSKGSNCHRKILFDALKGTSIWKDRARWMYRHGNEIKLTSDISNNFISPTILSENILLL